MATKLLAYIVGAFLLSAVAAEAQDWPQRPIVMVVSQSAGASPDIMARLLANTLSEQLAQGVVVENKPGGGNVIGANAVARSAPDGYTLYLTGSTVVTLRYTNKSYAFDALKDFTLISHTAVLQLAFMASTGLAVSTIDELVADLKRNPGKRFYATTGASDVLQMQAFARGTDTRFAVDIDVGVGVELSKSVDLRASALLAGSDYFGRDNGFGFSLVWTPAALK